MARSLVAILWFCGMGWFRGNAKQAISSSSPSAGWLIIMKTATAKAFMYRIKFPGHHLNMGSFYTHREYTCFAVLAVVVAGICVDDEKQIT